MATGTFSRRSIEEMCELAKEGCKILHQQEMTEFFNSNRNIRKFNWLKFKFEIVKLESMEDCEKYYGKDRFSYFFIEKEVITNNFTNRLQFINDLFKLANNSLSDIVLNEIEYRKLKYYSDIPN